MAGEKVLGSMIVRILGQNAEFDDAIDKSEDKLNSFNKSASKIGGNLTKFITLPLLAIGVAAVKSAADMEQTQLAFETLLGSGEKAKVLLAQLKAFADTTPFEFPDVAQGAKTLLSFGISAEKILPITKQLGDIALGNSEKFKSLSLVFGQISSTGRLMGQDLLQLINVGFNPLQQISDRTGESMAELKKRMEAGGISADEVAQAFKDATSEGGRFFQGTEKLGKSFSGQLSTLKDSATTLARSFGELILPTLLDIVKAVSGIINELNKLDPETKRTIISFALAAAATGPLVLGLGKVAGAISGIVKAVGIAKTAISSLATLNPVFLWAAGLGLAIGLVASLVDGLKHVNEESEKTIQNKFGFEAFDSTKSVEENVNQFHKLADQINHASKTIRDLGGDVNNLNGDLKTTKDLTPQQTAKLAEAANAYQLLTPLVKDYQDKIAAQKKEVAGANEAQTGLNAANNAGAKATDSVSKAVAFQNDLVAKGFITEEEGLKNKIKLREDAIKGIEDEAAKAGAFSTAQIARIKELIALNEDNARSLETVKAVTIEAFDADAQAAEDALERQKAATLDANAGFKNQSDEIAAGFAERAIAAKMSADAQVAEQDKIKAKTEKTLASLQTAYSLTFNSIQGLVGAVFDFQMASYDKDSEEYKKAAHDKAVAQKVFSIAQIAVSTAEGVAKAIALVDLFPFNFVLAGIVGVAGLAQAAIVAATPIPDLAEGGIVPATTGGRLVNVAEAGQAEVIAPLDKLGEMLDNRGFGGGASASGGDIPVSLTIQLDRETWYSGIFQATRNRTVLISAGAVVN